MNGPQSRSVLDVDSVDSDVAKHGRSESLGSGSRPESAAGLPVVVEELARRAIGPLERVGTEVVPLGLGEVLWQAWPSVAVEVRK